MKTRILSLILTLVLLLPALAGCGKTEDFSNPGTDPTADLAETEPDYSWFAFPEETNTLVLYSAYLLSLAISPAVDIFEKLYPEVRV